MVEVSKNEVYSIGKTIYDYFKKNKTYPKSIKIKGTDYTIMVATHLMAELVATNKNTVTKINVGGAKSPTGDRCNRKVVKSVYQDMSKRLVQYNKQNGRLPNYVTIDGKQKCSIILFMLQLSKILSFMKDNGAYPSNILINSNDLNPSPAPTGKKYGHATQSGCDNRGQNTGYYCGCHSLQEVFRNLTGKVVPQSTIASVAGTTTSGTDHDGLNTAVAWFNKKYGYNLTVEWKNFSDLGWSGIKKIIDSNNQDCVIHNLYRNQWGHYETINKVYNTYSEVQNSLGDYCSNGCYCGYVEERSHSTFQSYISGISQKSIMVITRK